MGSSSGRVERVFLVDDHEVIRQALATWIERSDDLELAGEASNIADALRGISEGKPDVAVIDLQLGSESGITICKKIHTDHPGTKSVILTGVQDHRHFMEVVAAGASGYLSKVAPMAEILDGIRAVAAGKTAFPGITESAEATSTERDEPHLSQREEKILELVAAGLTNHQIASRLGIADQTVKNHVSKLLQKLGLQSRTQAAVYAAQRRSGDSF